MEEKEKYKTDNYTIHCKLTQEEYEKFRILCQDNYMTQNMMIKMLIQEAINECE